MDMLDKSFSRELNRRTGEKAIKIDANSKAITRKRGKNALNSSSRAKTQENIRGGLFKRLNIRFPWLKLAAIPVIGLILILNFVGLTVPKAHDPYDRIKVAPMSKHVRVTNRVLTGKKLVVLTFDDGPSPSTTPKLLDILAQKDVPATFFMLGSMAKKYPDLVKRIEKEGHEAASHTMYHQNLVRISASAATADINEAKNVVKNILKHEPRFTRPPYGNINNTVRNASSTPLILWSVDSEDWRHKNPKSIINITMSEIYDGSIILMHDIYPTSVDAMTDLIDSIRKAGYEFASIDEICKMRGINPKNGAAYYNFVP